MEVGINFVNWDGEGWIMLFHPFQVCKNYACRGSSFRTKRRYLKWSLAAW